jgi:hypothetical protein
VSAPAFFKGGAVSLFATAAKKRESNDGNHEYDDDDNDDDDNDKDENNDMSAYADVTVSALAEAFAANVAVFVTDRSATLGAETDIRKVRCFVLFCLFCVVCEYVCVCVCV